MSVHCEIRFPSVGMDEMRSIDYRVMHEVFLTHTEVGCLADESVYQRELLRRLRLSNITAEIEVPVVLSFRTFSLKLKLDLVVLGRVIYELKTVSALNSRHMAQLLSYLYLTNSNRGKLINFRPRSVKSKFANSTLRISDRRSFEYDDSGFDGSDCLRLMTKELVSDWGTGLDASLYRRAILHCSSEHHEQEQMLPMTSGGESVGYQRFHLLDPETALAVTTYKECKPEIYRDFEKLLAFSPLKRLHWVNIVHHHVLLTTIRR